MSDSPAEGLVLLIVLFLFIGIGYATGIHHGEQRERDKAIKSQDYVDRLRTLDSAENAFNKLKKDLNNEPD